MEEWPCMNNTERSECITSFNWTECTDAFELNYTIPMYYSYRYRLIGTFFQGAIFVVGLFGNIMFVTIVCKNRSMRTSTNCYLVSLAVADMIVLVFAVPENILSYYLVGRLWVFGDVGCGFFIFVQYLGINSSTFSLVAFTIERYTAICHPMRAQKICSLKRAKRIIALTWILAIAYCSPWLVLATTKPLYYRGFKGLKKCDFKLPRNRYLIYFFTDLILFYLSPLVLTCILYALIGRSLYNRKFLQSTIHKNSVRAERIQVVKMLALIVAVFAVLWLPYRWLLVYNSLASLLSWEPFMNPWFLMFAKTCVFINSAINPILYNAMSSKFRRAFQKLLVCGRTEISQTQSSRTRSSNTKELTELC